MALFVTAHPDDESMFFAPAILRLVEQGLQVVLLCLSTGNAHGLGQLRSQELRHACSLLGIEADDIVLVDDPSLPDGMLQQWPPAVVATHVAQAVRRFKPQQVYTFDAGGVSGHPNHLATCAGVLRWWTGTPSSSSLSNLPELWQLETVGLPRKYLALLEVPLSHLLTLLRRWQKPHPQKSLCIVVRARPRQAWRALLAHRSQMVWYRRLWLVMSRYMYINTFVRHF
ncbi:hypothetical protein CHLNCDRAFT_33970 [Chlorella variabilis]|uniref:N-acetylglucosaminylphosphatidylinositol deacetylase n=1 Tax=Chlorella variabilis TaxID=554065 RepID=E1Z3W5_CHLVA|nr:hypothetical protein CHLNCDRAFT_33970 [Chlorella variabilis]EFN59552.1 hypothetical protein CHLNCDRAFT_33970 [Chlorella variabilis]|eukprot:XP_005851654.1 hypothetical protein CHLNCDRAFT_33970 [Chlorella variabilis]